MFKKLLKFGKGALGGVIGGALPIIGATQVDSPIVQAVLYILGGITGGATLTYALGAEFLGQIVSMIGNMRYGKKWEAKIEPTANAYIDKFQVGLRKDNK